MIDPSDFTFVDFGASQGGSLNWASGAFGGRGFGVDIDPARIRESRTNAIQAGVGDRVTFRQEDLFATDLSQASVLTLYLLPEINLQLRPRILSQMRPGTRVVSNSFDMGDWRPDRRVQTQGTNILLWIVPARVAGTWRMSIAGGPQAELALTQRYQDLSGTLSVGGRRVPITEAQMRGARIAFTADLGTGPRRFEGVTDGGGIAGTGWQAVRVGGE